MNSMRDTWETLIKEAAGRNFKPWRYQLRKVEFEFFEVEPGGLKAKVRQGKQKACFAKVSWPEAEGSAVDRILGEISKQAIWPAKLLSGELPDSAQQLFDRSGTRLFPAAPGDMNYFCQQDGANILCRHVVWVLLKAQEAFCGDPVLFLTWRGMERERLEPILGRTQESGVRLQAGGDEKKTGSFSFEQFWGDGRSLTGLSDRIRSRFPDGFREPGLEESSLDIKGRRLAEWLTCIYEKTKQGAGERLFLSRPPQ